jgi:hypothetical protein
MTLDVFPDPRDDWDSLLTAAKAARWPTATISTSFPTSSQIAAPVIQHAWDGSPSEQSNRQIVTGRFTIWTPKGKIADGIALAQLVRAYLLDSGTATTWRFRRGPGPSHGVANASGLPFCTFTLTAETRPTRVA